MPPVSCFRPDNFFSTFGYVSSWTLHMNMGFLGLDSKSTFKFKKTLLLLRNDNLANAKIPLVYIKLNLS